MARVIGLDIGTASVGWALVEENDKGPSKIIKAGVRVNPISTDEEADFTKGKSITTNAERTLKRSARRNLQRYKLRRRHLIELLRQHQIIDRDTVLPETGKESTHSLWKLRARAATHPIGLEDLGRVLLSINKKRGYKSSRKAKDDDEGQAIDGMQVARQLQEKGMHPGQLVFERMGQDQYGLPEFYPSDLQAELEAVWKKQTEFYPEILTDSLKKAIEGKGKNQTWAILKEPFGIEGIQLKGNAREKQWQEYQWRTEALKKAIEPEHLAIVLQGINGQMNQSSSYLGNISDRSKQLYLEGLTVGQYLYQQLQKNKHTRLKNQVFFRQDYIEEFEQIWKVQSAHCPQLTDELKEEIRDVVIFYQRRLKSQKGLIAVCELEGQEQTLVVDGKEKRKIIGPRVVPKSSPLFQEFKIWQSLNDVRVKQVDTGDVAALEIEHKELLASILNQVEKLEAKDVLKLLGLAPAEYELNYTKGIQGNRTQAALLKAYREMAVQSGHDFKWKKAEPEHNLQALEEIFTALGIDPELLYFNSDLQGKAFENQPVYQLWHLLYSFEENPMDPESKSKFFRQLGQKFGFTVEQANLLYQVGLQADYGKLSTRAIKKLLPEMKAGKDYAEACAFVGYEEKVGPPKNKLELLPKNSLRNPVVEKILNQMVNVVNALIDQYGKPDEVRIELARELKKSAAERERMTKAINDSTRKAEEIRKRLKDEVYPFTTGVRVTRNDIIKFKLWQELADRGYRTLYTNTPVELNELYTKKFDVEHILPQAKIFDDSFSNKTIETRDANLRKGNDTALEFMLKEYGENSDEVAHYKDRVEQLLKKGAISKSKRNKLLMLNEDIPNGFVERDLRNTQFIVKKARNMLRKVVRTVNTTTGSVTDVLREDWQLVNVLQELNWDKYERQGLVTYELSKDGKQIRKIQDWTKRNDHRHHVMDAIAVAFTRPSHIQYLNFKNARANEDHKKHKAIVGIEEKETYVDSRKKRRFKSPIPLAEFRAQVKEHLEHTLVSYKAKNKVLTKNINKSKKAKGYAKQDTLTPRGQLHKETVYGRSMKKVSQLEKVGSKFDQQTIEKVANSQYRAALMARLQAFENDPKKAFAGKNTLAKNPIYLNEQQSQKVPEKVKLAWLAPQYTIRKPISPDLKIDKVVDEGVKRVLQARLAAHNNNPKEAFVNLDKNPIWLNESQGIQLKRVTITGVSNAEALHTKKDHFGNELLNKHRQPIPADFVSTGNNHHAVIYEDGDGNLHDAVVSFYEAVMRKNAGQPIIDREPSEHPDWKLCHVLKTNECFVFPNPETDFDPNTIDLMDESNYALISPNLYRVQKFSRLEYGKSVSREYVFRHHLETTLNDHKSLKGVTYKNLKSLGHLAGIVKVRIDHIGRIVRVGEA